MTNERDMIDLSAPSTPASDEKAAVGEIIEAPTEEVAQVSAIPPQELARLSDDIVTAIKTVYDPEIPVDIYELGLIYKIDVSDERNIAIEMTLTAPGCPVAGEMPVWVENAVNTVEGVGMVDVHLVFDPPWDPSRMTDEARVALDMF
ncbi:MAG: FeS assembly SUF system protein [Parvibaculaceae bacterium]|jgi:FeS assembly SUF system protein|nr:SUF system Fe-S cluster assembly protein [Parvibaculaceae bacterium]